MFTVARVSLLLCSAIASSGSLQAADAASIFAKSKDAIVTIETSRSAGTAFVTGNGMLLVTAYHVIEGENLGSLRTSSSKIEIDSVVGLSRESDIAVFKLKRKAPKSLILDTSRNLATGSKIFVIGTPLGFLDNTISEGIVSGKRGLGSVSLLQITAPVSPGSSGSPVLSNSGKVVGVVSFQLRAGESLNFATSAADVSKIIKSAGTKKSSVQKPIVKKAPSKQPPAPKLLVPNGNPRLEALARKLSDPVTADEAARKLKLEGVKALPYLFAALPLQNDDYPESPSPDQLRVIETIVSNGTSAIPFALKYLGKDDNWNYINILELIGAPASPALCKQLQSKDYKVRRDVTWILASAGTKAAIPFLLKSLKDSDVIVRANAAGSLGRLGNNSGLSVLSELLGNGRQDIRDRAVSQLGLIDSEESVALLEKLALNPQRNVTLANVGYALQHVGKRGVPVLIRMLSYEGESEVRSISLWQFLETKDRSCSEALVPLLKDQDDWIRAHAAQLLGEFKATFAVNALLEVLTDSEPSVRSSVAHALGEIGAKSAVEPLRKLLLTEKEEDVIEAITTALGELE